jgi:hypothetical protein
MTNQYQYPGQELKLFEEARNWKKYLSAQILPFISGKVLEVGAGISETTPFMINDLVEQWTCLEPDDQLFNITESKIVLGELPSYCKARRGTLNDLEPAERFDTIVYIDVLEHIKEDKAEIAKALSHLNEGGYLVILSPAFQFLYNRFDRAVGHYRRYNKRTLREVMEFNILAEKKLIYLESWGTILILINRFIFRKTYPSKITVKFWDRFFIPLSKITDKLLLHSFGKSIIGVWQIKKA